MCLIVWTLKIIILICLALFKLDKNSLSKPPLNPKELTLEDVCVGTAAGLQKGKTGSFRTVQIMILGGVFISSEKLCALNC